MEQLPKKARIVLLNDELIKPLVHELEDALKFAREEFDLNDDVGNEEKTDEAATRIRQLQEIVSAVGSAECPYCDDNHGRLDGRGCRGCNMFGLTCDPEIQAIMREGEGGSIEGDTAHDWDDPVAHVPTQEEWDEANRRALGQDEAPQEDGPLESMKGC